MDESIQEKPVAKSEKRPKRLTSLLFAFGTIILLFHNVVTDYTYGVFAPDGIYVPNPTYKPPSHQGGETLVHTFRIYNLRPRLLSIEAQPDCGCTKVSWKRATVLPFGWKDLTARVTAQSSFVDQPRFDGVSLRTNSASKPWLFVFLKD